MTADAHHILMLAGTFEARQLAGSLTAAFPEVPLTASFAGAVRDLPDLGVRTRIGGFGGARGLTEFLTDENVSVIIDATHPFAARMSQNAVQAAKVLDIPVIRLERPEWQAQNGDNWQHVSSIEQAAAVLPKGARAFLAVGRKDIQRFFFRTDISGVARMIEAPETPLPDFWTLILSRPGRTADREIELFQSHAITHLVTKNSGGSRSFAKLEAARHLKLPVIMTARPALPATETATDIPDITAKIDSLLFRGFF